MNNNRLTSTEITNLIVQYQQETLSICIGKYVLATVKDSQIRSVFQYALDISEKHVKRLKKIFNQESFPVPNGFTDKDVNLDAPPLFTDPFWLEYLHGLIHIGLSGFSLALSVSVRRDIRDYFYQCTMDAMEVNNQIIDTQLSKGLYNPPPYYSTPKKVEHITNLGYTLDLVGKKRPLNTAEAGNIAFNLKMTSIAKALHLGFYQVTKNKEIRQFLEKGLNRINKNFGIFSTLLREENLRVPELLDTQVTNSTVAPFSDKLIMYKVGFLVGAAQSYYGTAMTVSMRADIIAHCEASILRGLKLYSNWGTIMINNGWIEKLPDADDRIELP